MNTKNSKYEKDFAKAKVQFERALHGRINSTLHKIQRTADSIRESFTFALGQTHLR